MAFFARPNLDDLQFKQLTGSTLTLSGQTKIATTTGLTLSNGIGGNIIITASGATGITAIGQVMTYNGSVIKLMPSTAGSGGTPTYNPPYKSPSTCTVGGLPAGTILTGKTLSCLFEQILAPTVSPTITPPSHSAFIVNISPIGTIHEVGAIINVCVTSCFNRGCITPQYCGTCCFRSGLANTYNYTDFGSAQAPISSSACCNCHVISPHPVTVGNNIISGCITYLSGSTPAYNSDGSVFSVALPTGATSPTRTCTICGLYPYFYGKIASGGCPAGINRPNPSTTICSCIIAGCGKNVADSIGTISINFNSGSDDYIWFATPNASATKTCWFVTSLNNGVIGGAVSAGGNLFPTPASVAGITTACWAGQTYKIYVSNYQSGVNTIMELRNS